MTIVPCYLYRKWNRSRYDEDFVAWWWFACSGWRVTSEPGWKSRGDSHWKWQQIHSPAHLACQRSLWLLYVFMYHLTDAPHRIPCVGWHSNGRGFWDCQLWRPFWRTYHTQGANIASGTRDTFHWSHFPWVSDWIPMQCPVRDTDLLCSGYLFSVLHIFIPYITLLLNVLKFTEMCLRMCGWPSLKQARFNRKWCTQQGTGCGPLMVAY